MQEIPSEVFVPFESQNHTLQQGTLICHRRNKRKDVYSIVITIHNIKKYFHFGYHFHREIDSFFLNEKLFRMSSYHIVFSLKHFQLIQVEYYNIVLGHFPSIGRQNSRTMMCTLHECSKQIY